MRNGGTTAVRFRRRTTDNKRMQKSESPIRWVFFDPGCPWTRAVPKALGQKGFEGRAVEGQPEDMVYSLLLKIYLLYI